MNKNLQMQPNTDHTPTMDEVRASMLRWFAEAMGDNYTVEQWRSFKAHLYPDPPVMPEVDPNPEPDYEAMYEDRYGYPPPWRY